MRRKVPVENAPDNLIRSAKVVEWEQYRNKNRRTTSRTLRRDEMLGEVNFHSRPQWHTWAEYSVIAASLLAAFAVLVSA
jgi:hypothetical protein